VTVRKHPDLPILTPGEFRRRIRPYLPGTVLEVRKRWRAAKGITHKLRHRFVVGPYCSGCGNDLIWLFRPDGTLDMTADRPFLRNHFRIIAQGDSRRLYTFPRPWPSRTVHLNVSNRADG